MNELQLNDYGRFHFTLKKKGFEPRGFDLVAKVVDIDRKFVLLQDNDGLEYLPKIANIDSFESMLKPEEL